MAASTCTPTPERRLVVIDPTGRELFISVGAAVFNLRVAVRVRGRIPVQRLLPASYAPNLAARITLGTPAPASTTTRAWAWAVNHRHSNRWSGTFGPRSAGLALPMRDFGLMRNSSRRPTVAFEATPTIALLHTPDDPERWLRAGQALQRILLTSRLRGLSATLMTQALEIPQLRDRLTHPGTGHAEPTAARTSAGGVAA